MLAAVDWDDPDLDAVLQLAESCDYEVEHSYQVTRLALQLFDELYDLHGLGGEERFFLQRGALLHDIGWIEGQSGHHKAALRIILESPILPFGERERLVTGSIARYHRKALPKEKHTHFAALAPEDQHLVSVLAGVLRVADGLDRTHRSVVVDLACRTPPGLIEVTCATHTYAEEERLEALDKGRLLERVLDRQLIVDWRVVGQ